VHHTTAFPRVQIRAGTDRIVAHVGAWVLGELADRSGLTQGLSAALAPLKQRRRGHDRGQVLTQHLQECSDIAVTPIMAGTNRCSVTVETRGTIYTDSSLFASTPECRYCSFMYRC